MPTVLIAGGTGLIGTALTNYLRSRNYTVIILSRSCRQAFTFTANAVNYAGWNTDTHTMDAAALSAADYIINLAGAGVADKRWTTKRKNEIRDSRINSGHTLVKSLKEIPNKVKAFISISAIGWYGADPVIPNTKPFTEADKSDTHFLGDTCRLWEESVEPVAALNIPLIKLRVGIVLSEKGGALREFMNPVKFGVAAILGSGKQMISWIHIHDLCRMIEFCMIHEPIAGIYNAVAPKPVNNKTLTVALAKKMKGNFFIPIYVPAFVLKIVMGEMSIEVLKSATVSSKKIQDAGFTFLYPSVEAALDNLCRR